MAAFALTYFAFSLFPAVATGTAGAPPIRPGNVIKGEDLLDHLNLAIRWHRLSEAGSQWLGQPSDDFFFSTQRNLSDQVLQRAFASARAELPLVPAAAKPSVAAPTAEQKRIARMSADRASRAQSLHNEIDALDSRIRAAGPEEKAGLATQREALEAEFNFYEAQERSLQAVGGMLAGPAEQGAETTLAGQIEALAQSVPEALGAAPAPSAQVAPAMKTAETGGIIARTIALFAIVKNLRSLDQFIEETVRLQSRVDQLQAPLRAVVRDVIQQGDQAGEHLTDDPGRMAADRSRLDALTGKFNQLAAASLPLREESFLLDQCLRNLRQWRESIDARYSQITRSLLGRAIGVLAMLAAVVALSELWRHLTFRYVQEDLRRRQFLRVRRIITSVLMAAVIAIGFISDFSSLATFAGLLTAGIAVALQTIIVSVAAYFFLIGRYGVRVGDRITVTGSSAPSVTGEVTDVGFVRFFLMELDGSGPEARPTGRSITFPNSVIFVANPIYRQMPGADFVWREAAVSLAPGADAAFVKEKLLSTVNAAYAEYRHLLEPTRPKAERMHGVRLELPKPFAELRAPGREVDVAIGFPASLRHASEIDRIISKCVSEALAADSNLRKAVAGDPRIGPIARA